MINFAIAFVITAIVSALILYSKKKEQEHKKRDHLIGNIHFLMFKDAKK